MIASPAPSGNSEAIVVIKAPQIGQRHGETVCCAGIDIYGNWLRLYPVSFRHLESQQKFARWDRIRFDWRRPNDDPRPESLRVDQQSIEIVGSLKPAQRERFLAKSIVTSLARERAASRSLALLRPEIIEFLVERRQQSEIDKDKARFEALRDQGDLFTKQATPYSPCPFQFKYRYRIEDGERFGTCQDWEIEATFFKWSHLYGSLKAVSEMERVFGQEYPKKGMLLAMGTHSLYPDTWLINGVLRLDAVTQHVLF